MNRKDIQEIKVKKVNLQQDIIDRLEQNIEMKENNIKYQQEEYLKLLHRLDNKEPFGLNCLLFTYDELVDILTKKKVNWLYTYIYNWFMFDEEEFNQDEDKTLYFAEDGIEVVKGDYWIVNINTEYACVFDDIDKLNRKLYDLEKEVSD